MIKIAESWSGRLFAFLVVTGLFFAIFGNAILRIGGELRATTPDPHWSQDDARAWYVEIKRAAKYARIAIVATGDLARLNAEESAARRQYLSAARLPLPAEDRAVCEAAALAVLNFIKAARAANMNAGPASYERQKGRWDALSDQCHAAIQRPDR